jgi:hypothetical protein
MVVGCTLNRFLNWILLDTRTFWLFLFEATKDITICNKGWVWFSRSAEHSCFTFSSDCNFLIINELSRLTHSLDAKLLCTTLRFFIVTRFLFHFVCWCTTLSTFLSDCFCFWTHRNENFSSYSFAFYKWRTNTHKRCYKCSEEWKYFDFSIFLDIFLH